MNVNNGTLVFTVSKGMALLSVALLLGCESDNEHFCSKYAYFYKELTAPGVLSPQDLRPQLSAESRGSGADKERAKMALFVLDDIERKAVVSGESARVYCLRRERWKRYR